jgi:ABC-type branched-subunit amino acid transport system ATPase component
MREEGYIPRTVNEHLQVSLRTGACHLLACASFVGMDEIATKESFDWVSTMPKIVKALCIILRLLDDLQTYEVILISQALVKISELWNLMYVWQHGSVLSSTRCC